MTIEVPEARDSLWRLAGSPIAWAAHFLLCYATAAIWCAKYGSAGQTLTPVRVAIAVYTVLALVPVLLLARSGYRRHRLPGGELPHDRDSSGDRHRFLGFATVLLSGLSAITILYQGLVAVFIRDCR